MIVLMIGGKIAPRPSDLARRSWIHCSQAARALARRGVNFAASSRFSQRSIPVKKARQYRSCRLRSTWSSVRGTCSSGIAAKSGTGQEGLEAQMTDSGTTMPRDQEDIL